MINRMFYTSTNLDAMKGTTMFNWMKLKDAVIAAMKKLRKQKEKKVETPKPPDAKK